MMGPAIPVFRYGYGSFYISSEHEGPETRLAEGRRQPAGEGSQVGGFDLPVQKILSILSDFTQYTEYLRNKEVD